MRTDAVGRLLARVDAFFLLSDLESIEEFEEELTRELRLPVLAVEEDAGWNHDMLAHTLRTDPRLLEPTRALVEVHLRGVMPAGS